MDKILALTTGFYLDFTLGCQSREEYCHMGQVWLHWAVQ